MRRLFSTHLKARIDSRAPSDSKTAVHLNAMKDTTVRLTTPVELVNCEAIVREHNFPLAHVGWDGTFLYPEESPVNFTPLRPVTATNPLDRAVREVPWESRAEIIESRRVSPKWYSECPGTPRREWTGGMIDSVRVRPVFNPFFVPYGQKLRQFDRWRSRDWSRWDPYRVSVRGGSKQWTVPTDIFPRKDELGEYQPPALSGRYQADIKRQYAINGLPWVWKRDYMESKFHILDKEPVGPKRWYKREYRQAKIREAMRGMPAMVEEYRKEKRQAKKQTWFEQIVHKLVGGQLAGKYITERKLPKL
jgi:hypothetical protein